MNLNHDDPSGMTNNLAHIVDLCANQTHSAWVEYTYETFSVSYLANPRELRIHVIKARTIDISYVLASLGLPEAGYKRVTYTGEGCSIIGSLVCTWLLVKLSSLSIEESMLRFAYTSRHVLVLSDNGVNIIGNSVFEKWPNLESVTLRTAIGSIGDRFCMNAEQLRTLAITNEHISSIGSFFCRGCSNLTSVSISTNTIARIGYSFMKDCSSLKDIHWKVTLNEVWQGFLSGNTLTNPGVMSFTGDVSLTDIHCDQLTLYILSNSPTIKLTRCSGIRRLEILGYMESLKIVFSVDTIKILQIHSYMCLRTVHIRSDNISSTSRGIESFNRYYTNGHSIECESLRVTKGYEALDRTSQMHVCSHNAAITVLDRRFLKYSNNRLLSITDESSKTISELKGRAAKKSDEERYDVARSIMGDGVVVDMTANSGTLVNTSGIRFDDTRPRVLIKDITRNINTFESIMNGKMMEIQSQPFIRVQDDRR